MLLLGSYSLHRLLSAEARLRALNTSFTNDNPNVIGVSRLRACLVPIELCNWAGRMQDSNPVQKGIVPGLYL